MTQLRISTKSRTQTQADYHFVIVRHFMPTAEKRTIRKLINPANLYP